MRIYTKELLNNILQRKFRLSLSTLQYHNDDHLNIIDPKVSRNKSNDEYTTI